MPRLLVLAFACAALALLAVTALGCEIDASPRLITLFDVAPHEAEVGDRVTVTGAGFPKGKPARVSFKGALHRPGERPTSATQIDADGIVTRKDQIEVPFTDELEALFCGPKERAVHTTFTGDLEVAFSAASLGAPPISAVLHEVTFDVRPAQSNAKDRASREEEARRALSFLGIQLSDIAGALTGLPIVNVQPGSRAEKGGIVAGDVLVGFDHVRVTTLSDALPSGVGSTVVLEVRRADGSREEPISLRIDGFKFSTPTDLLLPAFVLFVVAASMILFLGPPARSLAWLEARLWRAPPTLTGLRLHTPARVAEGLILAGLSALFLVVPFGQFIVAGELDIGLLYLVGFAALFTAVMAVVPTDKLLRACGALVSQELPAILAIVSVVVMTGSFRLREISFAQGGEPWGWYLFKTPASMLLFVTFMTSSLTASWVSNDSPLFRLSDRAHLFIMSGLAAALFLGGWQVPGLTARELDETWKLQMVGGASFLVKTWGLFIFALWLRRALPWVRVRDAIRTSWKLFIPASLAGTVLTFGWLRWNVNPALESALAFAMFTVGCLGLARFIVRRLSGFHFRGPEAHMNPFI